MSCGETFPPLLILLGVLTRVAATPWRLRSARNACSLAARDFPRTLLPRLSLPSHKNWVSFFAVADIAINQFLTITRYSMVTLLTSSRLVRPTFTFSKPARRRFHIPSLVA